MPTELHLNDSGTWRVASEVHVNDGGVWRACDEVHVNDGGIWRQVFGALASTQPNASLPANFSIVDFVANGLDAFTDVRFTPAGDVEQAISNGSFTDEGDWTDNNAAISASDWEIRATLFIGSTPTTGTMNTWQSLSTIRTWGNDRLATGTQSSQIDFEVRQIAPNTANTDTIRITLTSTVDSGA